MTQQQLPRVALLDIETAPIKAFAWDMFETNLAHVIEPTFMLSFAYKWLGQDKVHTRALCDYPGYSKNKINDKALVSDLWDVLDRADIVIAHNGDAFDIKKTNARFIVHGLSPPTPFKSIDTLKIARQSFRFDSNKLDNIGRYLQVGKKLAHTGIHLWLGCMDGDMASWRMMKRYNAQDVRLLEQVYEKLKPWAKSHPMLTAYAPQKKLACPTCLSHDVISRGWNIAKFRKTPRLQCKGCGHWFSGPGSVAIAA
jgi:DNA polymerase elongation subunit (family B)